MVITDVNCGAYKPNTAAVTTIDISASTSNTIASGSKFTLYGITAA